jgi:hypothetical protein
VNRRAESEIQSLSQRLNLLVDKVQDVEDAVRQAITPPGGPKLSSTMSEAES